ncbi:MAG TPA: magnesium transporter CorA family protein [Dehalococcoidales bacterium]|nr:magnesium transporter CorA family protein [Dehalococcoidales bacterium]
MTTNTLKEKLNISFVTLDSLTWINVEKPGEPEKAFLSQNYSFHPLDLDDCLSHVQRPKIDEYANYLFLVYHFPVYNKTMRVTESSQLSVFIGKDFLITVHEGRLKPLIQLFKDCQEQETIRQQFLSQGSVFLLYRIIDKLVDYCFPIINKVGENVDALESRMFSTKKNGIVREISVLRRDIISLRRIIGPMRTTVTILEPKVRRFNQTDLAVYFGDTVDHLDKIWEALGEYKEVIEGLNNTYDSLASNRLNEILRVLTILATIGTVLMVITGFYGMNVPLPGGSDSGSNPLTWVILLLFMGAVVFFMLLYFKRKDWL